jgi:hypothetical protein
MRQCLEQVEFGESLLLTDVTLRDPDPRIRVVPIERITSARAYSQFVLQKLADFIGTSHVLIVQWDGFILDAAEWDPAGRPNDFPSSARRPKP